MTEIDGLKVELALKDATIQELQATLVAALEQPAKRTRRR